MTTRFWRDPSTFIVFIGISTFVFYRLRIVPEHFWAARRFVPIILPGVCLAIACALAPAATRGASVTRRLAGSARHLVRLILFALAAWSFWSATSAIRTHVEFGGIEGKIDRIASRFGSQDLLVVESRNASDVHVIALPLAYIWGKPALVLNTPKPDRCSSPSSSDGRASGISRCTSSAAEARTSSRATSRSNRWAASAFRCRSTSR